MGHNELSTNPPVAPSESAWVSSCDQLCVSTKQMGRDELSNSPSVAPCESAWVSGYDQLCVSTNYVFRSTFKEGVQR